MATGCVAGALEEQEYRRLLTDAGFSEIDVEVTRVYDPTELAESVGGSCCGGASDSACCGDASAINWDDNAYARFAASGGRVVSAFVRAQKPVNPPAKSAL